MEKSIILIQMDIYIWGFMRYRILSVADDSKQILIVALSTISVLVQEHPITQITMVRCRLDLYKLIKISIIFMNQVKWHEALGCKLR